MASRTKSRILSVFSLAMINVIAIDSLRNLPINAEYGFSVLFFYLIGFIFFLVPTALVAAELATKWPKTGGSYVWVREAFGPSTGFLNIWLQWIYNVVWFPTILAFIAVNLAYLFDPSLADHKIYLVGIILILFAAATLLNLFGMHISSWISEAGAIFGTLLPILLLIVLGFIWLIHHPSEAPINRHTFFPDWHNVNNLAFLTSILFSLMGIEMSCVHAEEVKNPRKDYPRALLISSVLIIITLALSSLAIAFIIPHKNLTLLSGLNDALKIFFTGYHIAWAAPIIEMLIVLGAFAGISAWVIGSSKGLLVAAKDQATSKIFSKTNRFGAPSTILIGQAIVVALLSSAFILLPSVNGAYWFLSNLTAQLGLLYYLILFLAAIYLRYKVPDREGTFLIPGGKIGLWLVCGMGIIACLVGLIIGFLPPGKVNVGSIFYYETGLVLGIFLLVFLPFLIYRINHKLMAQRTNLQTQKGA